ncbi:MAG: hypothetical protein PUF80_07445 [Firmicutes bacterium]|nr:hypothetical protein [Bacillota bacterium]
MKLYQEILGNLNGEIPTTELLELKCYRAIEQIKKVIEDERLSDANCFARIEEIVCILEELGTDGGSRHDF